MYIIPAFSRYKQPDCVIRFPMRRYVADSADEARSQYYREHQVFLDAFNVSWEDIQVISPEMATV